MKVPSPTASATRRSISALSVSGVQRSLKRTLKTRRASAGDHVGRGIADVDGHDLEVRGIEIGAAGVERRVEQRAHRRPEPPQRIVGDVRIGDVALRAMQRQPPGQRAAPAVLDRVAERCDAGRLADDAMVEGFAARQRPVEQLRRAVDRRPLLVAGDEKADRARERGLRRRNRAPPRPPPRARPSCRRPRGPISFRRRPRPRRGESASAPRRPSARRRCGRRRRGSARPVPKRA